MPDNTQKPDRMAAEALDLTAIKVEAAAADRAAAASPKRSAPVRLSESYDPFKEREGTRTHLARGLLWLLAFVIGGVLIFVGLGRLDGTVITQSIFPSLIALAGTALGFYFGSQSGKNEGPSSSSDSQPSAFTPVIVRGDSDSTKRPPAKTVSDTQAPRADDGKPDDSP